MTAMGKRLGQEDGWGLVSSVLVVGILLAMAMPLMSLVDTQQAQSAKERKSESSFNLAEAALDASVFVLGKSWPGRPDAASAFPCTAASDTSACPSSEILAGTYTGGDYTNRAWSVDVRDDDGTEYFNPDAMSPAHYDANRNGKIWVVSQATAAEGERAVVALVKRIDSTVRFPRNAVTAGWFTVTTGGNKVVVDSKGETAQAAPVAVRCSEAPPSPGCADYRPDHGQISPDTTTTSYAEETAVSPEILEGFRDRAISLGTYYTSCPQDLDGEMVFIESGNCHYAGGGSFNSATAPGMVVVGSGSIDFGGGMTYYGMVYAANLQRTTDIIVTVRGAATIVGSIAADAGGGVRLGSNGLNLVYDDAIFPNITMFSAAQAVQGSWRELPAS